MSASVKDIEVIIKRKLEEVVPQQKLNQANIAAQKLVIKLWQKQLSDGIDEDGKRIPKLSKSYGKFKKRYIKGINHRETSSGKSWLKDLQTTTEYRANNAPNFGRLTGKSFSAMAVSKMKSVFSNGTIKLSFKAFINDKKFRRAQIWNFLAKKGRKYGFAGGSNNRGKKHQNEILKTILGIIFPKANFKNSGKVNIK